MSTPLEQILLSHYKKEILARKSRTRHIPGTRNKKISDNRNTWQATCRKKILI
ncbi:hypothetical protein QA596_07240 [Balneolales bacterium ANBcel1]|nr:hypothetical protein [Balneolales bacterium ANBcel1]